ncbi:hypothetical protein M045_gp82 [Mycobacterium phage HINdeR]|uniref:Uncharacterized protein n=1 Tax=Mycobacterium phage HINdeR TaxID=1327770 RepID=R4JP52_9CAUD|nr:hypothetical protein M045_gp82 [Mycobacterium phage HINdeR]AGK87561.1 hypothetical protein PBI_HINDER_82 [Mycobacterium phage HINdeR]
MKRTVVAQRTGESSTGTPHGLLVERESDGRVRFTVVGHDGKKRHAAVILSKGETSTLIESLTDSLEEA